MQEQGKRLLLACALALAVLLIWQTLSPQKKPPPKVGQGSGSALTTTPKTVAPTPAPTVGGAAPATKRSEEKLIKLTFPNSEIAFSNHGGVLKSWRLTDKRYE